MLNPSFFVAYELAGVGGVSPLFLLHTLFTLRLHTLGT